jgi:hypothetical protein
MVVAAQSAQARRWFWRVPLPLVRSFDKSVRQVGRVYRSWNSSFFFQYSHGTREPAERVLGAQPNEHRSEISHPRERLYEFSPAFQSREPQPPPRHVALATIERASSSVADATLIKSDSLPGVETPS